MCGIIGYIGNKNTKGVLIDGLKRLEYRGYDSAGLAIIENGHTEVFRSQGRIEKLEKKLSGKTFSGTIGIGHTRWATHGAPTEINAHPHHIGLITLVHNGIIENYLELKNKILSLGRSIKSETDSEIVAHLIDIELVKQKSVVKALREVLSSLRGSYAFVVMSESEPESLFGVACSAPLLVGVGENETFIASDVQAILNRTNKVIYLEENEIAICRKNSIKILDKNENEVPLKISTINWSAEESDKLGYRHYMLKEIHEQPQAVVHTIDGNIDHKKGIVSLQSLDYEILQKIEKISIVACGTARHAALVGKYLIEQFARIPVDVDYGSEFRYRDPILDKKTLLILISQSGETADTIAGCKEGKNGNIPTLSICNVRGSTLTRLSDITLYTNAGPEIGVASTKAFSTQLAVLYMLATELGVIKNVIDSDAAKELTKELLKLPALMERILYFEKEIEKIATENQEKSFFFFMGRGIHFPIALEGALKLKEISYLHSEGYAAGELKHGPIALIDRHTAIIVLAPKSESYNASIFNRLNEIASVSHDKIMANLQEVKSRGAYVCTVGTENDEKFMKESNNFIGLPHTSWGLTPILSTLVVQMLAYYIALQKGTDIDKPRNLAKSVTVE